MDDREQVHQWLAHSDISASMFGPPDFPEMAVPTWEEFQADYVPHYFDGSQPMAGRSFIIEFQGVAVGHINYNNIHPGPSTELDIWMASSLYTAQGFGTDALITLCRYLRQELQCARFYIAPSARNAIALRAYGKAGFIETADIPDWFVPDYKDTVVMRKTIP
jgi:diamine N-acetyltransferase